METVKERFLRYVAVDTQSEDGAARFPSTEKQFNLARLLRDELVALGASDVKLDANCYVTATIPARGMADAPALGLIAHMDTASSVSGANVRPVLTKHYDGGDIPMGEGYVLSPKQYPALKNYVGEEIICTDGSTLLGGDDKAGVAEIMTLAERLLSPGAPAHGTIRIGFTPDEEVGRGVDFFDVEGFAADFAYTVDGGAVGDVNYENFNAASADVVIHGVSIHPGSARGKMVNAALLAMELHALLPVYQTPACTDGYEGFFHLCSIAGTEDRAAMHYIIRDHDRALFEDRKRLFSDACAYMNKKYGAGTVELTLRDSYYNMKEKIDPRLITLAKAAMERVGAVPTATPIRGGTDGARLSYMGLPCPNLCTGGHNCHGRYEFISVQSMERVVDVLEYIATAFTAALA